MLQRRERTVLKDSINKPFGIRISSERMIIALSSTSRFFMSS